MTVTALPIPPTKRSLLYMLWAGIIIAVLGGIALAAMTVPVDPSARFLSRNRQQPGVVQTASGLQYKVLRPGAGTTTPTDSDVVLVNYEGKLPDGSTFDRSPQPTPFAPTDVVPGFGEAVKLMKKGAKYRFWIKPTLGYGAPRPAGAPPLQGKAAELARQVLIFDVEMIDFLPQDVVRQRAEQMRALQQMQGLQEQGGAGAPR
ncbi:MAG: FKBP-type peptidyl-prolyl cis-trans isomerase [Sphingomonas sp.]|uniref:FKBP-type peptidyl-prolyl cis-trans isomerase n=1 Tax=Sphingomonas sp. TaxID=28214 RepID=UPI0025FA591D|nr:FKBP-type peptidyl-prolyl cis-trans isomerase [Sphingomonas sp.]MBX9881052.1 FKBP-type peptidyl-prolyl cis-trans isomerase [Sphingomonas sp.]